MQVYIIPQSQITKAKEVLQERDIWVWLNLNKKKT
jgi:hypothetical protein